MSEEKQLHEIQFDYAWKWFVYHADQRIKAFNFMIISLGVLTTALLTATGKVAPCLLGVVSLVAFAVALLFSRLDRRNRDLVWRGEDVLMHLERTKVFPEDDAQMEGRGNTRFRGILIQEENPRIPKETANGERTKFRGGFVETFCPIFDGIDDFLKMQDSAVMLGKHRFIIPTFAYLFAIMYLILAVAYIGFGDRFPVGGT